MQFTTIISFLFVAAAIAAPITFSDKRQIDPTGGKTFYPFPFFLFSLFPLNIRLIFYLLLCSEHLR